MVVRMTMVNIKKTFKIFTAATAAATKLFNVTHNGVGVAGFFS